MNKGNMRILKTLVLGLLAIGAAGGAWTYINGQIQTPIASAEEQTFEVPKGSTLNAIGQKLQAGLHQRCRFGRFI